MKKILYVALVALTSVGVFSCGNSNSQVPSQNNNVMVSPPAYSDVNIQADQSNPNFDVPALAEIVKKTTNPKLLEQAINDPNNNITNLDLDKDGTLDAISVTESGQNQLVVNDISIDPAVTVATINISQQPGTQTATLNIQGSPAYCGPTYVYNQPGISLSTLLLWHYLFTPHPYYVSPYRYHSYPSYYSSHRTVVRKTYVTKTSNYAPRQKMPTQTVRTGSSNMQQRGVTINDRKSLNNATSSQRDFKVRDANKTVGSGGFGNRSTTPTPTPKPKSSGWFGSSSNSSNSSSGNRSSWGSRSSGSSSSGWGSRSPSSSSSSGWGSRSSSSSSSSGWGSRSSSSRSSSSFGGGRSGGFGSRSSSSFGG